MVFIDYNDMTKVHLTTVARVWQHITHAIGIVSTCGRWTILQREIL